VGAAERHRHRKPERQGDADGHALGNGRPQPGEQQRGRQPAVHQHGVTAQPRIQGSHASRVDPAGRRGVILAGTPLSSSRPAARPATGGRTGRPRAAAPAGG